MTDDSGDPATNGHAPTDDADADDANEPEMEHVGATVPKHQKAQVEAWGHGAVTNFIRNAFAAVTEDDATSVRDLQKMQLQQRKAKLREEAVELQDALAETFGEYSAVTDELASMDAERVQQDYDERLSEIEEQIRGGMSDFPDHGKIQEVVEASGMVPEVVINELEERNPDLPEHAFTDNQTGEAWTGTEEAAEHGPH